jgi:UDP-glucose 4-epimerase
MRIVFTGASSFTGYWFVRQLMKAGHEVCATFTRPDVAAYGDDVRGLRVRGLLGSCRMAFGCSFGDTKFLELLRQRPCELLCHHAADVTDYRSANFDVARAFRANTANLQQVLAALAETGCRRILLTGSVFEGGEGAGSEDRPHFSPYGLSKAITAEAFRHYTRSNGMHLGKFVIPNPFGPCEEPRFTAYLMRTWFRSETAVVRTPAYIRDNIHVSLLALAYVHFAESLPLSVGFSKLNPSGYIESQGAFAERFAQQMRTRLGLPCTLELPQQTEFTEPRIRVNCDALDSWALGWNEILAWDDLVAYYVAGRGGMPTDGAAPACRRLQEQQKPATTGVSGLQGQTP